MFINTRVRYNIIYMQLFNLIYISKQCIDPFIIQFSLKLGKISFIINLLKVLLLLLILLLV